MDLTNAQWRKSSHSVGEGSACVEVAFLDEDIAVRDSKSPDTGVLAFPAESWRRFLTSLEDRRKREGGGGRGGGRAPRGQAPGTGGAGRRR
ncbi:DUF397 domain-containing protein, partial [Saccharopolyspora mangrovi]